MTKLFECKWKALELPLGVSVAAALVVLFFVLSALHWEHYWLSATFGVVFVVIRVTGGRYDHRGRDMVVLEVVGALLTALAFFLGTGGWGLIVLAAFLVTLAAGLSLRFGLPVLIVAVFLNIWFIVALSLAAGYHTSGVKTSSWKQALAWLAGTALCLAVAFVLRLLRDRKRPSQQVAETPGQAKPIALTRPVVLFAAWTAQGPALRQ